MPTVVVGVTGGIASGKSSVSKWFTTRQSEGIIIELIDADILGHSVYQIGTPCHELLIEHFGDCIKASDGTIDRKALGAIVFSDKSEMAELQKIVWPNLGEKLQGTLLSLKSNQKEDSKTLIVVEAAVMFEARWHKLLDLDLIITVQVDPQIAKDRLLSRTPHLTPDDAEKRIESQMSNAARSAEAHLTLDNNGSVEALQSKLETLWSSRIWPMFS